MNNIVFKESHSIAGRPKEPLYVGKVKYVKALRFALKKYAHWALERRVLYVNLCFTI